MLKMHKVGSNNSKSLYSVLLDTPPSRTAGNESFIKHCCYMREWLPDILDFEVGKKKVRRLRFQAYIRREATLDSIVNMMTSNRASNGKPKESKAIVVFGAAQCSSGFRYFPAPVKGLVRRLQRQTHVIILDEHYTSQRCSKCAFGETELKTSHFKNGQSGGRKSSKEIHGVRFCPHENCRTVWNRDVNAARNIRLVFEHMAKNSKVRPSPFAHLNALST